MNQYNIDIRIKLELQTNLTVKPQGNIRTILTFTAITIDKV